MAGFLKTIFAPNDGSRRKVHDAVVESREKVEQAANHLEETIRELLLRNDRLTGRDHDHAEARSS